MANARDIQSPATTPRQTHEDLPHQDESTGVIASSLDILFSYSRSRLFYGENLPSSPSFIRYRPDDNGGGEYYDTSAEEDEDGEVDEDEEWEEGDRRADDRDGASIAWSESEAGGRGGGGEETPDRRDSDDEDVRRTSFGGTQDGTSTGRRGPPPLATRLTTGSGGSDDLLTPVPGRDGRGGGTRPNWNRQTSYGFTTPAGSLLQPAVPLRATSPGSRASSRPSSPTSGLSPSLPNENLSSILSPPALSPNTNTPHFAPALSPSRQHPKHDELTPLVSRRPSDLPSTLSTSNARRASGISHRSLDSRMSRTMLNGNKGSLISLRKKIRGHEPGTSTYGQTLFNTVAVLIGVGLLSESLAFYYAGWICGTVLLVYFALLTNYTAKQLAAIIRLDPSLKSYSDIARKAFGAKGIAVSNFLFCMELFSLSVAFVVLFGDTLHAVLGHFSSNDYKVLCFIIVLPTIFLPLRLLSFASLLGVLSTLVLLVSVVTDSLLKKEAPGSLWEPMPTSWTPEWDKLPLVFGLLMAGFSGHAVVPSLARDMAEPERFDEMINVAYVITTAVYLFSGALGYLMFGNTVMDEITKNLMITPGFPPLLNKIALWMIVLSPLTKFALCTRPLNLTLETILGLDVPVFVLRRNSVTSLQDGTPIIPPGMKWKRFGIVIERTGLALFCVIVAILIPDFSRVMAFLGSFSAFLICVIIPVLAHSALIKKTKSAIALDRTLFIVSVGMLIVGTYSAFSNTEE
ncbi:transmembrane amino acid transporter protein-domain-containing protein [Mrakia frigida]|uniref:transmembrane amino acid transporter protein-domain-containing protein n=1 Tax=Mrakia frigida TaxID=29902 RepID=UPI003FCBF435